MIVTIINGFVGAFVSNISENFANLVAGHVFIQGVEKSASGKEFDIIRDDSVLLEAAKEAGIPAKYVTKRSNFEGTLVFAGKTSQLQIAGVDFANETFLPQRLVFTSGGMARNVAEAGPHRLRAGGQAPEPPGRRSAPGADEDVHGTEQRRRVRDSRHHRRPGHPGLDGGLREQALRERAAQPPARRLPESRLLPPLAQGHGQVRQRTSTRPCARRPRSSTGPSGRSRRTSFAP